jgi:hypothetical protein
MEGMVIWEVTSGVGKNLDRALQDVWHLVKHVEDVERSKVFQCDQRDTISESLPELLSSADIRWWQVMFSGDQTLNNQPSWKF